MGRKTELQQELEQTPTKIAQGELLRKRFNKQMVAEQLNQWKLGDITSDQACANLWKVKENDTRTFRSFFGEQEGTALVTLGISTAREVFTPTSQPITPNDLLTATLAQIDRTCVISHENAARELVSCVLRSVVDAVNSQQLNKRSNNFVFLFPEVPVCVQKGKLTLKGTLDYAICPPYQKMSHAQYKRLMARGTVTPITDGLVLLEVKLGHHIAEGFPQIWAQMCAVQARSPGATVHGVLSDGNAYYFLELDPSHVLRTSVEYVREENLDIILGFIHQCVAGLLSSEELPPVVSIPSVPKELSNSETTTKIQPRPALQRPLPPQTTALSTSTTLQMPSTMQSKPVPVFSSTRSALTTPFLPSPPPSIPPPSTPPRSIGLASTPVSSTPFGKRKRSYSTPSLGEGNLKKFKQEAVEYVPLRLDKHFDAVASLNTSMSSLSTPSSQPMQLVDYPDSPSRTSPHNGEE